MEKFAFYMVDQLKFKLTPGQTLFDISKGSDRYVLYKVGPVISVSVSKGDYSDMYFIKCHQLFLSV